MIVFSTWWFDQVVASLYSTRTFLYADGAPAAATILNALQGAAIRDAVLAWSREQPEDGVAGEAVGDSCYQIARTDDIPERQVRLLALTCHMPEPAPGGHRIKP